MIDLHKDETHGVVDVSMEVCSSDAAHAPVTVAVGPLLNHAGVAVFRRFDIEQFVIDPALRTPRGPDRGLQVKLVFPTPLVESVDGDRRDRDFNDALLSSAALVTDRLHGSG